MPTDAPQPKPDAKTPTATHESARVGAPVQAVKAVEETLAGVPHWPAALAFLAIGGIYLLLADRYSLGPQWLLPAIIVALQLLIIPTRLRGQLRMTRTLALGLLAAVTGAVEASAFFLVQGLINGRAAEAQSLLLDAALIWLATVLVFALWYWEIDGGGPARRHRYTHHSTDFIFPQMTLNTEAARRWSPGFLDYLFLSFNTSTAFSPTDTLVLSRQAKALMMLQSLTSLTVVGVLVARAVNTLPTK